MENITSLFKNTLHIFGNVKNINKICPVWYLNPEENNGENKIDNIDNIEFKNVTYSYNKNNNNIVLDNMNFKINKGEVVYIDGESGKGKSTIINLICRLFDINKGEIIMNNNNINNIDIKSLKKCISVIPQNIIVFNGTIKDNIILDNEYNSVRLKNLIELLRLPNENEKAEMLSHGQKQRVLIGRSLYNIDKSVYIFDEYLSAVDEDTSNRIHNYVINFIKENNKIGIFISHDNKEKVYYDKIIKI